MSFKVNKVRGHNLFIVKFESSFYFASALVRLIISQDDPKFANTNCFSNQDCYDWLYSHYRQILKKQKDLNIFEIYYGLYFNMNSLFKIYNENDEPPCSIEDQLVVDLLFREANEESHVICFVKGDNSRLLHELAHYLYQTSEKYVTDITKIMETMETKDLNAFNGFLKKLNYIQNDVDEIQAYMSSDKNLTNDLRIDDKICSKLRKNLKIHTSKILSQIK